MHIHREITAYTILTLFFFQLLSEFVAAIYAFGLLGVNIPNEVISILFFFAPLVIVLFPAATSEKSLTAAAILGITVSVVSLFPGTRMRMLLSGFGLACFLILMPAFIVYGGRMEKNEGAVRLTAGVITGTTLSILIRTLNSGVYPYEEPWFRTASILAALIGIFALVSRLQRVRKSGGLQKVLPSGGGTGTVKLAVLGIGIFACIAMLYFVCISPYVVARWSGAERLQALALTAAGIFLISGLVLIPPVRQLMLNPWIIGTINAIFIIGMLGTMISNQTVFPPNLEAYPVFQLPPGPFEKTARIWMLLLTGSVFLNFLVFVEEFRTGKPTIRKAGAAFFAGALFLLIAIVAQIMTTVYDYIPVAGPLFRNKFHMVFTAIGICMMLPLFFVRKSTGLERMGIPESVPIGVALLGFASITSYFAANSRAAAVDPDPDTLSVFTWNIQQGYSRTGERGIREQLAFLQKVNPDIIGLQETDSTRVAGGNSDIIGYFSDRLGLHEYYGPKTVQGTFGLALLSRYPIENPKTFFMAGPGEQTAAIHAQIRAGGRLFNIFVTHLGNDGDMIQQEAVLRETAGLQNVILMGDFNFKPDTMQYAATTGLLNAAWTSVETPLVNGQPARVNDWIDHVFVSEELYVTTAEYRISDESDHPSLEVGISLRRHEPAP